MPRLLAPAVLVAATLSGSTLAGQVPRVDPQPLVVVPAIAPTGAVVFERVDDAAFLPDGRFVVADRGANLIRYFDPTGKSMAIAGGVGSGPGEFRRLWGVEVCGDRVIGHELVASRLSRFDFAGQFRGDVALERPVEASAPLACLGREALAGAAVRPGAGGTADNPVVFGEGAITVIDTGGSVRSQIVVNRAAELVRLGPGGGAPRPLGFALVFGAVGRDLIYGTGQLPELTVVRPTGPERLALPLDPRPVSAMAVTAANEALLTMVPPRMRDQVSAMLASLPRPERLPYYRRIVSAPNGTAWIDLSAPGDPSSEWLVTDGRRILGRVTVPGGLMLLAVQSDRILGTAETAEGDQQLQVHRLLPR